MSEVKQSKDLNLDPEKLKTSIKGILDHLVDLTVEVVMGGNPKKDEKETTNEDNDTSKTEK